MAAKRKGKLKGTPVSFFKIVVVCMLYVLLCVRFLIGFAPSDQPGHGTEELSALRLRLQDAIMERQRGNQSNMSIPRHQEDQVTFDSNIRPINPIKRLNTCHMNIYLRERNNVCEQVVRYPYMFTNHDEPRAYNSCDVRQVFNSCYTLKRSYLYGKEHVSEEEKSFPLAFAMKIHTNANQAHRLLRLIYRKHNFYCIHVDQKAPADIYNYFRRIGSCFDNVVVIDDRVSVVYSSIKQIEAEFRCVDAMMKLSSKWKYYINLTGQEFMLRTNLELVKILKLLNGSNEIESYVMENERHKYALKTKIIRNYAMITKERKPPFEHVTIRKGSAYGMLTREFLNFTRNDLLANEFFNWLHDAYAPEEMIWATLNALPNAPGGTSREITSSENTFISRAVIWQSDNLTCRGKYVHWVCIYGVSDLQWLYKHRNIVANKFYEGYQPLALDCLEREIYRRTIVGTGVGESFNISRYNDITYTHSSRHD